MLTADNGAHRSSIQFTNGSNMILVRVQGRTFGIDPRLTNIIRRESRMALGNMMVFNLPQARASIGSQKIGRAHV